jgi:hypothetical protein
LRKSYLSFGTGKPVLDSLGEMPRFRGAGVSPAVFRVRDSKPTGKMPAPQKRLDIPD